MNIKNNVATVILLIIFIASAVIFVFVANEDLYSVANSGANVQINGGTDDEDSNEGNDSDQELPSSELDEEDNENTTEEDTESEDEEDSKNNNTTNTPVKKPTTNAGSSNNNSNSSSNNTNTGTNNNDNSGGNNGSGSTGNGSGTTGSGSTGNGSGTTDSGSTGNGTGSTDSGSTGNGSGSTDSDSNSGSNNGSSEITEEEKKNMFSVVSTYDANVVVSQNGTTIDLTGTIVRKTPTSVGGSSKYVSLKFVAPYELLQSQLDNATLDLARYDARGNRIISQSYTGINQGFTTDGLGYFELNAIFSTGDYYILTIDWGDGLSKTYRLNINVEVLEA